MKFLECQRKCMHLGEKTGHKPTQRDKPSNVGEKTEDMPTQRGKPSNLGEKNEIMPTQRDKPSNLGVDGKKSKLFKKFSLVRALDDDEAYVSLGQVTKLAPDVERQVFEGYRSGQVALQAESFIDVHIAQLSLAVVRRFEWSTVRQITSGSSPSSRMMEMDNSVVTGWPPC
ncbi:hypothetical protein TNCV_2472721 [Trichonephila clavipes]|nr:hypothetical protein TNCV_2472721 [Trichonephila clavipes]